ERTKRRDSGSDRLSECGYERLPAGVAGQAAGRRQAGGIARVLARGRQRRHFGNVELSITAELNRRELRTDVIERYLDALGLTGGAAARPHVDGAASLAAQLARAMAAFA